MSVRSRLGAFAPRSVGSTALGVSSSWVTSRRSCSDAPPPGKVRVTFLLKDGKELRFTSAVGRTLMEVARDNKLDIEAACDGTCACSTCHVYLDATSFAKLPKPSEDELDMLDLAVKVKPTSRLSCQVQLTSDLDGLVATLPDETANQLS